MRLQTPITRVPAARIQLMKKISSGLFVLFAAVSLIAAQTPPPGAPAPAAGQEQQPSAAPAPAQEPAPLNQPAAPQPQTQPATETKPEAPMPQPPPPTSGAAAAAKPDSIPLPPFPSMRNAITTEKPIKGMPDGVIPRQKSAAGTAEPETVPKTTTEGGGNRSGGRKTSGRGHEQGRDCTA